jgi:phosphopantetheinyl transferase
VPDLGATPSHSLDDFANELSESEQERLRGMRSRRRRQVYLSGHRLLRRALDQFEPAWRANGDIEHMEGRPPQFGGNGEAPLAFNISHSGNTVGCAISRTGPVGFDLEIPTRPRQLLELAREYFAPAEYQRLRGLDPPALAEHFYQLWTLKESRLKARCGELLDGGMRQELVPATAVGGLAWYSYGFCFQEGFGALTVPEPLSEPIGSHQWLQTEGRWRAQSLPTSFFAPPDLVS